MANTISNLSSGAGSIAANGSTPVDATRQNIAQSSAAKAATRTTGDAADRSRECFDAGRIGFTGDRGFGCSAGQGFGVAAADLGGYVQRSGEGSGEQDRGFVVVVAARVGRTAVEL